MTVSAARLIADVQRYDGFGLHRLGSPGAEAALDWIAAELTTAGLAVSQQRFEVARQYAFASGELRVGAEVLDVVPQWWLPADRASFSQTAQVMLGGDARGRFLFSEMAYDQGAYLSPVQKDAIASAAAHGPEAVLLCIGHPSGEIFTYNVAQEDTSWPVPVILVAPKHAGRLKAAAASGDAVTLSIRGTWQAPVAARNIIGRTEGCFGPTVVVSTPVTSWFTSTGERAPGIACLLALARQALTRWSRCNIVFVATSGHEVGHGGMEQFLAHEAPSPAMTALWLHLGASLACHPCERHEGTWRAVPGSGSLSRYLLASDNDIQRFSPLEGTPLTGASAAIGELRDVHRAGYSRFAGMVGMNPLFHTPSDGTFVTSRPILAPVLAAFEAMMDQIDSAAG